MSFEIRAMQDEGIFALCDEVNVRNIIWRPLRRNNTSKMNSELLQNLALRYNKTQNQIILNWLVSSGFSPMVMSANPKHIQENIDSLDFKMTHDEISSLDNFRPPSYTPAEIDWSGEIEGPLVGIINGFNIESKNK